MNSCIVIYKIENEIVGKEFFDNSFFGLLAQIIKSNVEFKSMISINFNKK